MKTLSRYTLKRPLIFTLAFLFSLARAEAFWGSTYKPATPLAVGPAWARVGAGPDVFIPAGQVAYPWHTDRLGFMVSTSVENFYVLRTNWRGLTFLIPYKQLTPKEKIKFNKDFPNYKVTPSAAAPSIGVSQKPAPRSQPVQTPAPVNSSNTLEEFEARLKRAVVSLGYCSGVFAQSGSEFGIQTAVHCIRGIKKTDPFSLTITNYLNQSETFSISRSQLRFFYSRSGVSRDRLFIRLNLSAEQKALALKIPADYRGAPQIGLRESIGIMGIHQNGTRFNATCRVSQTIMNDKFPDGGDLQITACEPDGGRITRQENLRLESISGAPVYSRSTLQIVGAFTGGTAFSGQDPDQRFYVFGF